MEKRKLIKNIMILAAKEAGTILLNNFNKSLKIETKKDANDLVTNIDIASEDKVKDIISSAFPQHSIYAEESGLTENTSDYLWIIDPLDGTHNYIYKLPFFGVSIALSYKNEVVMACIFRPLTNQLFFAEKGNGAYLNHKTIKVSSKDKLSESLMVYDNQFHKTKTTLKLFSGLIKYFFTIRILGSASYDLTAVAEGSVEARVLNKTPLYDFAAGALIIEEAGGKVTGFDNERWNLNSTQIVASNGKIHSELLKKIKELRD